MVASKQYRASDVKFREARFDDYDHVRSLQCRYGLESKSREEWVHLWSDNPAYIENREMWPIGWVLEAGNDRVVGYLGNIPLWYELRTERLLAAAGHGWVVDLPFRSHSMLLVLLYFRQRGADLLLNTTAGPTAAKTFSAGGALAVPTGAWDHALFWISEHQGFASAALHRLPFGLPPGMSYPLSTAIRCWASLRGGPFRGIDTAEVEYCAHFDSRFDEFWNDLRAQSERLLGVRTREVLEWRFGSAIRKRKAWVLAMSQGSRLVAYSVFVRDQTPGLGLERVSLVDFQVLDEQYSRLVPMLAWAYRRCRQAGVHVLESLGFEDAKRAVIASCRPFSRKLETWRYHYKALTPQLAAVLRDAAVWDPCCSDGDANL